MTATIFKQPSNLLKAAFNSIGDYLLENQWMLLHTDEIIEAEFDRLEEEQSNDENNLPEDV